MSHVDEGALHAYLDGALDEYPAAEADRIRSHLDACAECAGRLEEERRVRGDAHAILALASPEVELPGFEELKAYVERTRPVRSPASARLWRLGWAASVVLALGTGWLVRGQTAQRGLMTSPRPATEEFAESDRTAGAAKASSAGGAVAEVPAEVAGRTDFADRQVARSEPGLVENEVASVVVPAAAPAPVPTLMAEAEVSPPSPAEAVSDRAAGLDATASAEVVALAVTPVAQAGVGASAPADVTPSREESSRARAESPVAVTSAMERSGAPARRLADDDEVIDPSVPSLVVPGLEVVSVTNLGLGTTASGVHVVQRLATGALVDIWHLEPEVDRDVLPAHPAEVEEVAELTENGWIVIRGATTQDELARLLAFLRPAGT